MSLSGSLTAGYWYADNGQSRGYTLSWSATQSIANNQSTITWWVDTAGTYPYQVAERTLVVTLAGHTLINKSDRVMRGAGRVASGSFTVDHASDGTFGFSVSIQAAVYTSAVNCTGSGSFTLNQIPRQANITSAINVTDEQNPYFTFNNPGGFDLTAALEVNPTNTHLFSRTISNTGSYTFELSESERDMLRSYLANAKSGTLRYLLYSNGGQFVSYADRTLTIVNADPTLEVTVEDENDATLELTGDSNKIIEGYSDAVTNASYSALKGASISSYKVVNGSQTLTTTPATFEGVSSGSFVFSVTDSRGNTTSKTINLTTVGYIKLTCNLDVKAPNAEGEMDFTVSGNYFAGSFGAVDNTIEVFYRYKTDGDEYCDWIKIEDISVNENDNTYTANVSLSGLDYRARYTFQAMSFDALIEIESVERIVKTVPVFDWGEYDFNFNVPVHIKGTPLLDMFYPVGSIFQSTEYFDPADVMGGKWEQLKDRFLLSAGDTHSPGTTGGSQTHLHDQGDLEACIGSGYSDAYSIAFSNSDKYAASRGNIYKVTGTSFTSGGARSHNTAVVGYTGTSSNMPPYLVVYMWKRIS